METERCYIRPFRPWRIVHADTRADEILFERTIFNTNKCSDGKTSATLDFSQTDISENIRLCFASYVLLGKISPSHAQAIIDEYKMYHATAAHDGSTTTLKGFLSLLGGELSGVFDDPMQGVLTGPFHQGLFDGKTLVDAFDDMCGANCNDSKDMLILYGKAYSKCRIYILDIAFAMARDIPSFSDAEIHSGEEFFAWWRNRCTSEIQIHLSQNETISLSLPDLPAKTKSVVTKIISEIAHDYARLAQMLHRPHAVVRNFIQSYMVELNEGMVNLPLNQYGKESCPAAKDLETEIKSSAGFPTTASCVKEVRVAERVLEDVFKRFFAVKQKSIILPRTQKTIAISQLGACPFPDYAFVGYELQKCPER